MCAVAITHISTETDSKALLLKDRICQQIERAQVGISTPCGALLLLFFSSHL